MDRYLECLADLQTMSVSKPHMHTLYIKLIQKYILTQRSKYIFDTIYKKTSARENLHVLSGKWLFMVKLYSIIVDLYRWLIRQWFTVKIHNGVKNHKTPPPRTFCCIWYWSAIDYKLLKIEHYRRLIDSPLKIHNSKSVDMLLGHN